MSHLEKEESSDKENDIQSFSKSKSRIISDSSDDDSGEIQDKPSKNIISDDSSGTPLVNSSGDEEEETAVCNEEEIDIPIHKSLSGNKNSEMLKIRSEAQRRIRESDTSLPYHVPKSISLDQFLNRKKNRPEITESWRKTRYKPEDEEATKLLLIRQEEAEKFYESDSQISLQKDNIPKFNHLFSKFSSSSSSSSDLNKTLEIIPKLGKGLERSFGEDFINFGDLEQRSVHPGLVHLQSRLRKHVNARKTSSAPNSVSKSISVISKISNKEGVEELRASTIVYGDPSPPKNPNAINFSQIEIAKKSEIPGAQILALKSALKSKLAEKKRVIRAKKEEVFSKDNPKFIDEEELMLEDEEPFDDEEEYSTESEPEPEPELVDKPRKNNEFADEEAIESYDDTENEEDSSLPSKFKDGKTPGTTPFSQMDNCSGPRWTPLDQRSDEDLEENTAQLFARKKLGFEGLLDESDPKVSGFDDVVGLCSGQFVKPTMKTPEEKVEDDDDEEEIGMKKRKRLVVSDDSDEEEEEENKIISEEEEENFDEMPEDVEYDSDENVIDHKKKLTKNEFLDKEAELSGSEEGSEDEDERGLDQLDLEEGDLDDIDENKVRKELGKIHHNQLLDQDKRDIRLFQEAFLEDGDLHSEKSRQRSYKWKDADENDELERRSSGDEEDVVKDEEFEKRAMERLEREKWLAESKNKINSQDSDNEDIEDDSQVFQLGLQALKTMKGPSKTSISPSKKEPLRSLTENMSSTSRGSFLSLGTDKLDRLAQLTKTKAENQNSASSNSKNFVFATVSPKTVIQKKSIVKVREPATKKTKLDRTLKNAGKKSIFGYL